MKAERILMHKSENIIALWEILRCQDCDSGIQSENEGRAEAIIKTRY